jgi:hypothetical protein
MDMSNLQVTANQETNIINNDGLNKETTQRRKFYDYMTLNPIVLHAAETVTGKQFVKTPFARFGYYPSLTEQEADDVMNVLASYLPRQPQFPPSRNISQTDLAYSASAIDCEGYCGSVVYKLNHRQYPGYRLNVAVSQNDRLMLQAVQQRIGARGAIYEVRRNLRQNRQCYTLTYSSVHALAALAPVYPHMIRKKEIAMMMLKFFIDARLWAHPGPQGTPPEIHKRRWKYHQKLKRML